MGLKGTRAHIDLLVERIAGHFLANPTRKDQRLGLLRELNLGNNDAIEDAGTYKRGIPTLPGILNEEADRRCFLMKKSLGCYRRFVCRSATNPHRCSVAFHEGSGTVLLSALFTNSTESIAAPS